MVDYVSSRPPGGETAMIRPTKNSERQADKESTMTTVTVYASRSNNYFSGMPELHVDHVWLHSEKPFHDWNCFGRGASSIGKPGSRRLLSVAGNAEWMAAVYGSESEGKGSERPAAGIVNNVGGVCQNVANRLLAMTEDNPDVSSADGNPLVVLAFGKYGIDVPGFKRLLRETARELNARKEGTVVVSDEELDRTIRNVDKGRSAEAEIKSVLDNLKASVPVQEPIRLDPEKKEAFLSAYSDFQKKRSAKHSEIEARASSIRDAKQEMKSFLWEEFVPVVRQFRDLVGKDVYDSGVQVLPKSVAKVLSAIQ